MELDTFELGNGRNGHANEASRGDSEEEEEEVAEYRAVRSRVRPPPPPSLLRVLRANLIIFLYTLPINFFSIVLLYGVVTMALSEMINTQWDDLIALTLALVLVPGTCAGAWATCASTGRTEGSRASADCRSAGS